MTKFLVGLEKFLHSLTHSFCRHIVKTFTFLYLFLKQQKVLHLFCRHTTKSIENFGFRCFFCCKNAENGVSQNVGQALTHTVTHTRKCADRFKEHRRGAFAFSPVFLRSFSAHMTCAMKFSIVCAASS